MPTSPHFCVWAVFLCLLGGCSPLERIFKTKKTDNAASGLQGKHFVVDPAGTRIGIRISELGKEFLLQGSVESHLSAPLFHGFRPRIVSFQEKGETVAMLEAAEGSAATSELQPNIVLATFPILQRESEWIFFEGAVGMSRLYGLDGSTLHAQVDAYDRLQLKQTGQTVQIRDGVHQTESITLQYQFSVYEPRKNFEPTLSPGLDQVGFFEVAPRFFAKGGTRDAYATKFAINGDRILDFSISDNTPIEFREAITDGILYWNKAFGREVVRVVSPLKSEGQPRALHNLVQWVPWDFAASVYADAQTDPRTGEILQAQIFMTSAFSFTGIERAHSLLELFRNPKIRKPDWITLSGFHSDPLCMHTLEGSYFVAMSHLLAKPGVTDAQILKVAQDYIRSVIAHQMGHVLGLRHNFSGSLSANFEPQQKKSIYRDYLLSGHAPTGLQTSSSVMDEPVFEEATLTGDLLVGRTQAFPYDQKAIAVLYEGKSFSATEVPPFCTDSHVGKFADCKLFGSGRNPVEFTYWNEKTFLEQLPHDLLWSYLRAKKMASNEVEFSLLHVIPDPVVLLNRLYASRKNILDMFRTETKWMAVERGQPYSSALSGEEAQLRNQAVFSSFWKQHQVADIFSPLDAMQVAHVQHHFGSLLESYQNQREKWVSLTEEDINLIRREADHLFAKLPVVALQVQVEQMALVQGLMQHPVSDALASVMRKLAYTVVKAGKREGGEAPFRFTYSWEVRLKAAGLLKQKSADVTWGRQEAVQLRAEVKQFLADVLGGDVMAFSLDTASREKQRWVLENRALLVALGVEKAGENL